MQDLRMVKIAIQHRKNSLAIQAEKQADIDALAEQARAMAGL